MTSSVSPQRFRPPWPLRNAHVQTILGHFLKGRSFRYPATKRFVAMPDGDQLVMHDSQPPRWQLGEPIVLIAHGLGGCHKSGYTRRMARKFYENGVRVVRLDMRGCGDGLPFARKSYNAGQSDDLRAMIGEAHRWSPASPIVVVGVSLGGNVILKLAGEAATRPVAGLARVVAVAPPIDLRMCSDLIALRRNRIYEKYFVNLLLAQLRKRLEHFPDLPRVDFPKQVTMRQFDELWTAPHHGFRDAQDYYHRSSALPRIASIRLPTLIITSRDDPFIAVEPFENLTLPTNAELSILDYGGHLGYLGPDGDGGWRWAESRIIDWALESRRCHELRTMPSGDARA